MFVLVFLYISLYNHRNVLGINSIAPIGFPLITATCISCPPIYSSRIISSYFLSNLIIDFENFFLFLQISTPKLEPSFTGFATIGKLIFFVKNFFLIQFFLQKNFGVLILFAINIFFELILFIALNELITPECVYGTFRYSK